MSDTVRLCRALAKAFSWASDQVEEKADAAPNAAGKASLMEISVSLSSQAMTFDRAADILTSDERERLGIVGQQPSEIIDKTEGMN